MRWGVLVLDSSSDGSTIDLESKSFLTALKNLSKVLWECGVAKRA